MALSEASEINADNINAMSATLLQGGDLQTANLTLPNLQTNDD